MFDINKAKAFTFDTGGTILDWHSGFKKGFDQIKADTNIEFNSFELANSFRKKSVGIITNQNESNLINFDKAHRLALELLLEENKISLSYEQLGYLAYDVPADLRIWDDFL